MTFFKMRYFGLLGDFFFRTDSIRLSGAKFYGFCALAVLGVAIIAYFLGCINFGIILSRKKYNEDIRTKGSGNAGATNMLRTYGKGMAALTFLGDFLKGAVAAIVGILTLGLAGGFAAAFAAMVGHAFPCFYGFKGGKGVAVSAGAILAIDWRVFVILIVVFVLMVCFTKFVSLGSVTAFFLFPLLVYHMTVQPIAIFTSLYTLFSLMMMGLGIYLHRSNLKRISQGCESKVSFKSKKSEAEDDDE
ncbi:MAG: glycerol-3-phosphate 1-O-acyltransferase PlsY [Ruminococcaceae bacterium]|nr:glycerol-3-phosphate 1-O-acyltransferase PlsY [Oscillospiraceae bacterium]